VNVGWGKEETQFKGPAARLDITDGSKEEQNLSEQVEDGEEKFFISWRGDSEYFCCSYQHSTATGRLIRVFDKTGVLMATSEPVLNMREAVCWR
jgi:elongator complex protein 1